MTAKPNATPSAEEGDKAKAIVAKFGKMEVIPGGKWRPYLSGQIAAALSDTRRKTLEEAARAVCAGCHKGETPTLRFDDTFMHTRDPERAHDICAAGGVWRLLKTEGESNG